MAVVASMALPIWIGIIHASIMRTQSQALPEWETAAGGKMAFEVASIKLDKGPARSPLFPLDNWRRYTPGGRLSAAFPVLSYIQFAYKVRFSQGERDSILDHSPKWIGSDLYAIEAKAPASARSNAADDAEPPRGTFSFSRSLRDSGNGRACAETGEAQTDGPKAASAYGGYM